MADVYELRTDLDATLIGPKRKRTSFLVEIVKHAQWFQAALCAIFVFLLLNICYLQIEFHRLSQEETSSTFGPATEALRDDRIISFKNNLVEVENDISHLSSFFETIEAEKNSLGNTLHELYVTKDSIQKNITTLSQHQDTAQNEVERSKSAWSAHSSNLENLRSYTVENITTVNARIKGNNKQLQQRLETNKGSAGSLSQDEKRLENRLSNHETEFSQFTLNTNNELGKLILIQTVLRELKSSVTNVQSDTKMTDSILNNTCDEVSNNLKVLNDRQDALESKATKDIETFKSSVSEMTDRTQSSTLAMIHAARETYDKYTSDLENTINDAKNLLQQMKDSENTIKEEIEKAKVALKDEILSNITSNVSDTEQYVQQAVELLNNDVKCGGTFIALSERQKIQTAQSYNRGVCVYTIRAIAGKRIEYGLPAYPSVASGAITIDDGVSKFRYDRKSSYKPTRVSRANKLVVTFNQFYGPNSFFIDYRAVE